MGNIIVQGAKTLRFRGVRASCFKFYALALELFGIVVATVDDRFCGAFGSGESGEIFRVHTGEETADVFAKIGFNMGKLSGEWSANNNRVGTIILD